MRLLLEAPLVGSASGSMPSVQGFQEFLTDDEREGWNTGAYHKTLDDRHLLLLCRKCAPNSSSPAPRGLSSPHPASCLACVSFVAPPPCQEQTFVITCLPSLATYGKRGYSGTRWIAVTPEPRDLLFASKQISAPPPPTGPRHAHVSREAECEAFSCGGVVALPHLN